MQNKFRNARVVFNLMLGKEKAHQKEARSGNPEN